MEPTAVFQSISSLSKTLHHLTTIKLDELSRQKRRLDDHYSPLLAKAEEAETEKERLSILTEAVVTGEKANIKLQSDIEPRNLENIIAQYDVDLALGDSVLSEHSDGITKRINEAGTKYQYSVLFGKIFNEWLKMDGLTQPSEDSDIVETDNTSESSSYVQTGRPEMYDQRAQLESIIFERGLGENVENFKQFISKLFAQDLYARDEPIEDEESHARDLNTVFGRRKELCLKLLQLRHSVGRSSRGLSNNTVVSNDNVKKSIEGLLTTDLLSDEKRQTCKEILLSETIISEMASVMTMMLRGIASWSWSEDGLDMTFRRQLNGKYRCFLEEGVLEAIFLHYIGMEWSSRMKNNFKILLNSDLWEKPKSTLSKKQDKIYRIMTLAKGTRPNQWEDFSKTMNGLRDQEYKQDFFLLTLPDNLENTKTCAYDDAENEDSHTKHSTISDLKQRILHKMLAEAKIAEATKTGNSYTTVHTDFEWFGPSLSHEIIIEALRFVGVTEEWLTFFTKFLKVPCRFSPEEQTRVRQRGVPISHALSTFFGETMLFYLDFAINQSTGQSVHYYRLYDDIWFYSHDPDSCQTVYKILQDFAKVTDLQLNDLKGGSVVMEKGSARTKTYAPLPLPQNSLKWGFIELYSDYTFVINQTDVELHIKEFSRQLKAQKNILGYINAYNRYMKFFIRNFGEPSVVLGGQHVEQIIKSIKHIHNSLFPETKGDILAKIKQIIRGRFPDNTPKHVLDAWIVLPLSHGGLGLVNFALQMFPIKKAFEGHENYDSKYILNLKDEKEVYEMWKRLWKCRDSYPDMRHLLPASQYENNFDDDTQSGIEAKRPKFMSYEDFTLGRFSHSDMWGTKWKSLAKVPDLVSPERDPSSIIWELARMAKERGSLRLPLMARFSQMDAYWQWIFVLYGPGLLSAVGRIDFMDAKLIPLGMIEALKAAKIKWDQ